MIKKFLKLPIEIKEINSEKYTLRAVFSTNDPDRHGERVDQKTWDVKDFMTNPVVLPFHKHDQPPVGKVVELGYNSDGNLEGLIKFAAKEYEFANTLWKLYEGGYMNAFSVGFGSSEKEIDADGHTVLKNNTLYELSTVSIPANARALAKTKGLDLSALDDFIEEAELKTVSDDVKTKVLAKAMKADPEIERDYTESTAGGRLSRLTTQFGEGMSVDDNTKAWVQERKDNMYNVYVIMTSDETTTFKMWRDIELEAETEEKGMLEDAMANKQEKDELLAKVESIYYTFANLVYSSETDLAETKSMIKEMADLMMKLAPDSKKEFRLVEELALNAQKGCPCKHKPAPAAPAATPVEEPVIEEAPEEKDFTALKKIDIKMSNREINKTVRQLLKAKLQQNSK